VKGTGWLRLLNPLVADGLVATAIAVLDVLPLRGAHPPALAFALAAVGPLPLVLRRRWPRTVLALLLTVESAYALLGYPYPGVGAALLLGAYSVGAHQPPRQALPALGGLWAVLALLTALTHWAMLDLGVAVVTTGAAWLLGDSHRVRRSTIAELEERTALLQERTGLLELLQTQLADQAVAAERTRIARELHDVVAHSMSVIAIQSGAGERLIDSRPDQAREVLVTIGDVSRAALSELRRVLGVLRDGEAGELWPAPGLGDLPRLLAQADKAGLHVQAAVVGDLRDVPHALGLNGYRIIQEALTNVVKHAGPTRVDVRVECGDRELLIEVCNQGTGRRPQRLGGGAGLIGMRERVTVFGGSLEYGEHDGGFRVAARLPLTQTVP
jgi:signal transduction histidine kinase